MSKKFCVFLRRLSETKSLRDFRVKQICSYILLSKEILCIL